MKDLIEELKSTDGKDREAVEAVVGEFLYEEVKAKQPTIIVEVGTGNGYSSSWLALGLKVNGFGKLITFDPVHRDLEWVKNFDQVPQIVLISSSIEDNPSGLPNGIEFVFHDGDHAIDKIVKDLEIIDPYLSENATIYIHDTKYREEMGECLKDYFNGINSEKLASTGVKASSQKWLYHAMDFGSGLGIATKVKGETHAN